MRKFYVLSLFLAAACFPQAAFSDTVILAVASAESFERGLPVLRYPDDDVVRFTGAMTSMGGVDKSRTVMVRDGNIAQLKAGFTKARTLIAALPASGAKRKFVFYFTGHADSRGLHLSDGLLSREEFHKLIAGVGADTKIAILDSCYSGALAAKGVRAAEEFSIPRAQYDEPSGAVFLAATSGSDQAFEIDELKGSLFTHHLTAGLYGLADLNQDGLVTIEELYQYVYKQVSLNSLALPDALKQHPEYTSALSGRGALVMSFVSQNTGEVHLDKDVVGELTFSARRGVQIFRIFKEKGESKTLRLMPGEYDLVVRDGERLGQGTFALHSGRAAEISSASLTFRDVPNLKTVAKGAREDSYYGIRIASHVGSMWNVSPHLEFAWASAGRRLSLGTWRLTSALGGHRSGVSYERQGARTQKGESATASLIAGATGDFELYDLRNGMSITSLLGVGADYVDIKWNDPQAGDRSFDPVIPKVVLGLGTGWLLRDARSIEFSFRREWLFASERTTDDVLSFSASLFVLGYHF